MSISVKIFENDINVFSSILNEAASQILYHFTPPASAVRILKSGKFALTGAVGQSAEEKLMNKGKVFYLSATRSLTGAYHQIATSNKSQQIAIMFNLDGNWINQRYSAKATSYFGNREGQSAEAEDRIFSNKPEIPIDCISSIHILMEIEDDETISHNDVANASTVFELAKEKGIPVKLYDTRSSWLAQRKSVSDSDAVEAMEYYSDPESFTKPKEDSSDLPAITKITCQNIYTALASKNPHNSKLLTSLRGKANGKETEKTIRAAITFGRKPGFKDFEWYQKITQIMNKNKLTTLDQLINWMKTL